MLLRRLWETRNGKKSLSESKKSTISRHFRQWSKLWGTQVKTLLGLICSNLRWKTLQGKWISENLTSSAFSMGTFVFEENLPLKCCSDPTADWKGKRRWQGTSNSFYSTNIIVFHSHHLLILIISDVLHCQTKDEFAALPTYSYSEYCTSSSAARSYRYILQWQPNKGHLSEHNEGRGDYWALITTVIQIKNINKLNYILNLFYCSFARKKKAQ